MSSRPGVPTLVLALTLAGAAGKAQAEGGRPDLAALAAEIGAGQVGAVTAPMEPTASEAGRLLPEFGGGAGVAAPGSGTAAETLATAQAPTGQAGPPRMAWPVDMAAAWDFPTSAADLADRAGAALARVGAVEGIGAPGSVPVCALLSGLASPGSDPGSATGSMPGAEDALACDPKDTGG